MSIINIVFMGIALAMDALAVSIVCGLKSKGNFVKNALTAGVFFGFFQGLMTFLGWISGSTVAGYIEKIDHWIAFLLLSYIGYKMIESNEEEMNVNFDSIKSVLILSIATSIDALVAGIGLSFIDAPIYISVVLITLITFILSFAGVIIGFRINTIAKHQRKINAFGGIILISLGVKILIEHILL